MARSEVVVSSSDNAVSIQVEDDGQGIPSDLKEKVFDAFFTTRLERNASGLGLTIARRITTEAGGRIELSSAENPTLFELKLKPAPPNNDDA